MAKRRVAKAKPKAVAKRVGKAAPKAAPKAAAKATAKAAAKQPKAQLGKPVARGVQFYDGPMHWRVAVEGCKNEVVFLREALPKDKVGDVCLRRPNLS